MAYGNEGLLAAIQAERNPKMADLEREHCMDLARKARNVPTLAELEWEHRMDVKRAELNRQQMSPLERISFDRGGRL